MKRLPEKFCEGCHSHCAKQGAFTLHTFLKGEAISFSNNKNHMIFILSGSVRVRSESIGVFDSSGGEIILQIERGEYTIKATEDCKILALGFIRSFQVCEKMSIDAIKRILGDYRYTYHSLPINGAMEALVKSIIKYIEDDAGGCISIHNAKQIELFVVCRMYYTERELLEFFVPTLDKNMHFEALVKTFYPKAKSVEELAALCGYKMSTFKKVFEHNFKMTPYQWMLQQNRSKILTLLLDSTIPIKAVVAEFGFTNQSHLNLYCKRHWGTTSAQMRNGTKEVKSQ
ncbi:helix-turn-helix domain-containing protein [Bacteroides thetaiotaomicron]|uniref:helix-turn-helix domain-containing protein n=1 Tax=Bacteroides thetaiotaomicron TaxID=818 RepID=UPI001C8B960A|nr:helix-turn-helix domain-containing protein [Bacteroides thetaiotaomicron]MBX9049602.1 helix-turn-helix domain-containing protein [Bacteroides thetaiotaomicron]MBX9074252.1 helix-turn-helix domain-containing protein [Bacteroides thetaiotaomicron]